MSIIPVGNRKDQINQGPLRNPGFLNSDLFKKFGQGAAGLVDDPVKPKQQQPTSDLQQTMQGGGLDAPGQADRHEQRSDPRNETPQSSQGIQPAGQPDNNMSPFLTSVQNPEEQQQQGFGTIGMVNWVEQIVQGQGFIVNVDNNQGKTRVTLLPDPANPYVGFNWENWKQVLQRLEELGVDPSSIEYKNNSASFTLDQGGGKQVQKR